MKHKPLFGVLALLILPSSFALAQEDDKLVILHTASGKMVIEFFPEDASNHVKNFLKLAESGFYDRTIFHRIIKDFMIQGGDAKTKPGAYTKTSEWGTGNPGYTIDAEFNNISHKRGIVSMARSTDPNSAGSQFFIVHRDSPQLDGKYTVFGRLVTQESYETLDKIASLETAPNNIAYDWGKAEILKAEIVSRSQILDLLELGEPERTDTGIEPSTGKYTNKKLGISFIAPAGWLIQEPQKTNEDVPDIVAVGPKISDVNPTISVNIVFTGGQTLDQRIVEVRQKLQPAITEGILKIEKEERTTINGMPVHLTEAAGIFERGNSTSNVRFAEAVITTSDKFYTITYSNDELNFDKQKNLFENVLTSFTVLSGVVTPNEQENQEGGGCLIATAAYGSELMKQIQQLRELRNNTILKTQTGSLFLATFNDIYYLFSPTIADWERQNPIFKEAVKLTITPLVTSLSLLHLIEIDSEAEMLFYGLGILFLNIGVYFVGPALLIQRFRK